MEWLMDMVSFIPQDLSVSFKVFVYDPVSGLPVDSTELDRWCILSIR